MSTIVSAYIAALSERLAADSKLARRVDPDWHKKLVAFVDRMEKMGKDGKTLQGAIKHLLVKFAGIPSDQADSIAPAAVKASKGKIVKSGNYLHNPFSCRQVVDFTKGYMHAHHPDLTLKKGWEKAANDASNNSELLYTEDHVEAFKAILIHFAGIKEGYENIAANLADALGDEEEEEAEYSGSDSDSDTHEEDSKSEDESEEEPEPEPEPEPVVPKPTKKKTKPAPASKTSADADATGIEAFRKITGTPGTRTAIVVIDTSQLWKNFIKNDSVMLGKKDYAIEGPTDHKLINTFGNASTGKKVTCGVTDVLLVIQKTNVAPEKNQAKREWKLWEIGNANKGAVSVTIQGDIKFVKMLESPKMVSGDFPDLTVADMLKDIDQGDGLWNIDGTICYAKETGTPYLRKNLSCYRIA